jgi:hypothetical protein
MSWRVNVIGAEGNVKTTVKEEWDQVLEEVQTFIRIQVLDKKTLSVRKSMKKPAGRRSSMTSCPLPSGPALRPPPR